MNDVDVISACIERFRANGLKRVALSMTLLHEDWEMDNKAWIIEDMDGCFYAFTTRNGFPSILTKSELVSKIAETKASLAGLEAGLRFFDKLEKK